MNREEIETIVLDIIGEQFGMFNSIEEVKSLKDDLGADSLDVIEFVMELEERFEVSIDEDFEESISASDVVDLIEKLKKTS